MATFEYEALSNAGQEVRGRVEVDSQEEAVRKVREMGHFPTKIKCVAGVEKKAETQEEPCLFDNPPSDESQDQEPEEEEEFPELEGETDEEKARRFMMSLLTELKKVPDVEPIIDIENLREAIIGGDPAYPGQAMALLAIADQLRCAREAWAHVQSGVMSSVSKAIEKVVEQIDEET